MPPLELTLVLDSPDAWYALGDTVSGTVEIRVQKDTEVRGVWVVPRFVVEGVYEPAVGGQPDPVDVMPGGGHLRSGETREVEFEVSLPLEPPPYEGENFRLYWRVEARADRPMAGDVEAEPVELDVRVGEASREGPYAAYAMSGSAPDLELEERADEMGRSIRRGCGGTLLFILSLPLALGGLAVVGVFLPNVGYDAINWVGVAVGAAAVLPSVFLWRRLRRRSVSGAVGRVEIEADPQVARPGETIRCRVLLTPSRDLTLESVRLSLVAQEFFTRKSRGSDSMGPDSHVAAETLHTDRRELADDVAASDGAQEAWEESFRLADGIPYSIRTSTAGVRWLLRAEIEVPGVDPVVKEKPVVIRP